MWQIRTPKISLKRPLILKADFKCSLANFLYVRDLLHIRFLLVGIWWCSLTATQRPSTSWPHRRGRTSWTSSPPRTPPTRCAKSRRPPSTSTSAGSRSTVQTSTRLSHESYLILSTLIKGWTVTTMLKLIKVFCLFFVGKKLWKSLHFLIWVLIECSCYLFTSFLLYTG